NRSQQEHYDDAGHQQALLDARDGPLRRSQRKEVVQREAVAERDTGQQTGHGTRPGGHGHAGPLEPRALGNDTLAIPRGYDIVRQRERDIRRAIEINRIAPAVDRRALELRQRRNLDGVGRPARRREAVGKRPDDLARRGITLLLKGGATLGSAAP